MPCGHFPFFQISSRDKITNVIAMISNTMLTFWPWSYCFKWRELIDPFLLTTCHIHLRLNQVWKDLIPVKLLKDQACFKLTVEKAECCTSLWKIDAGFWSNSEDQKYFLECLFRFLNLKKNHIFKQKRKILKVLLNDALQFFGLFHSTAAFLKLFFSH